MSDKKWTITEKRVEQWETEYTVKELGITGSEREGLIQVLATEVETVRSERDELIRRLQRINAEVFASGVHLGSTKYFRVRGFCTEPLKSKREVTK